jgi:tetratricopeptide (TPR) repeat protein
MHANCQEEGAALITHHLVQGGADPKAIADHAERAANHAYMLAAYPEAERYYRLAIEQRKRALDEIQETRQKQAVPIEEHRHQSSLLGQLGECLRIQGHYEEARRCYEQALETWSQCATTPELQQDCHLLAMLCVKIGQTWEDVRNMPLAQQCYELGEQVLQEAGSVTGTVLAYLRLRQSYIHWHQGSYEGAFLLAQEAQTLFEQALEKPSSGGTRSAPLTQIQRTLAGDPVDLGGTYIALSMTTAKLGRYNDALDHLNRALPIFEQYHCQREIAITYCDLGDLYLRKADYARAQNLLRRSLSIAEHTGEVPLSAIVLLNLGLLQTRIGRFAEAEKTLRRGITLIKSLNDPYATSLLYTGLATTLQEQGEVDEAGTVLCGALRISRKAHMAPIIGVTLIALGQLRIEYARHAPGLWAHTAAIWPLLSNVAID